MSRFDDIELSEADFEMLQRMCKDRRRIKSLIGSEGAKLITQEWLIEMWGYYYEYEDDPQSDNSLRNFTKVSFRIKNGDLTLRFLGNKIENPPKTRDEFRQFAKWFGLEEK